MKGRRELSDISARINETRCGYKLNSLQQKLLRIEIMIFTTTVVHYTSTYMTSRRLILEYAGMEI